MAQQWGGGTCSLEEFEAADVAELPAAVMAEEIQGLFRLRNRVDAQIQLRLHRFDKERGFTADNALTTRAWLRWKCHISSSEASERIDFARRLPGLEITADALAEGSITFRHAALIARTAKEVGDKWESQAEQILVTAAKEVDPFQLSYATEHLKHCLEPDGSLADANRNYERRQVYLSQTMDGMFRLDGQLDAEGGAMLKTALDALMPPPSLVEGLGSGPRRADALVELARRQLDSGNLPQKAGQKPHLVITAELATLAKVPGSPAAELEWSQPVPAETARRLACDCTITPDSEGEPLNLRRTGRVVPGSLRRKLVARDRTCRFPGCDMPGAWCDAHHIKHWADGGATVLANLILFCRRHHRKNHEGGYQIIPP